MPRPPFSLALAVIGLLGCDGGTPIKYEVCDPADGHCILLARFKDFDSCEDYRKVHGMLCDSRSTPGVMTCREPKPGETYATAHCTK